MSKPRSSKPPKQPAPSPIEEARSISEIVRSRLIASSAGRCEFRGCNRDLYQHPVTGTPGNYSQAAHIVAFKVAGPRGQGPRPADINAFENLMLLCGDCHHLIDTQKNDYSVEALKEHKREHEERIYALTALGPEQRTTVIQVRGTIGGQPVDIPGTDVKAAVHPRYPARLPGVLVDLTPIQRENPSFFDLAREEIRRELRPALRAELESKRVQHYSVFALAPIPVLISLGRELGNKVNVDLFQKHRDPSQSWRWSDEDGTSVEFDLLKLRDGTAPACVGLLLSISGKLDASSVPREIDERFTLYEIAPRNRAPGVELIRRRGDLLAFRRAYRDGLSSICAAHGGAQTLSLFPAVPAPVAIACGQDTMPKAHPELRVFDNVKGVFKYAITTNTESDL